MRAYIFILTVYGIFTGSIAVDEDETAQKSTDTKPEDTSKPTVQSEEEPLVDRLVRRWDQFLQGRDIVFDTYRDVYDEDHMVKILRLTRKSYEDVYAMVDEYLAEQGLNKKDLTHINLEDSKGFKVMIPIDNTRTMEEQLKIAVDDFYQVEEFKEHKRLEKLLSLEMQELSPEEWEEKVGKVEL